MELCALLLRQSVGRDELKALLLEQSFPTKFAAACAVDAETFPESLLPHLREAAAAAEGGEYDIKVGSEGIADVSKKRCDVPKSRMRFFFI